jgi:N-acetylmuramoyl-L-alanine amidase
MKDTIIVHCSATPPSMDIGTREIREWHVNGNGWLDLGYNYVIRRDGRLENGRDLDGDGDSSDEIGAHARGFNRNSIGICLVGGSDSSGKPDANFTLEQYLALDNIVRVLMRDNPSITEVLGHRDLDSGKECPSFNVQALLGVD